MASSVSRRLARRRARYRCPSDAQRRRWLPGMCEAITAHPAARFYAAVAAFTQAFIGVEAQGFDMLD